MNADTYPPSTNNHNIDLDHLAVFLTDEKLGIPGQGDILSVKLSTTGRYIAVGYEQGIVQIWDSDHEDQDVAIRCLRISKGAPVQAIAWHPEYDNVLFIGTANGSIHKHVLGEGLERDNSSCLQLSNTFIHQIAIDCKGQRLAVVSGYNAGFIEDINNFKPTDKRSNVKWIYLHPTPQHSQNVVQEPMPCSVLIDDDRIVVVHAGVLGIRIMSLTQPHAILWIPVDGMHVFDVPTVYVGGQFSPSGDYAALCQQGKPQVDWYCTRTGRMVTTTSPRMHKHLQLLDWNQKIDVIFLDEDTLITGGAADQILVWRRESQGAPLILTQPAGKEAADYFPAGHALLTASDDFVSWKPQLLQDEGMRERDDIYCTPPPRPGASEPSSTLLNSSLLLSRHQRRRSNASNDSMYLSPHRSANPEQVTEEAWMEGPKEEDRETDVGEEANEVQLEEVEGEHVNATVSTQPPFVLANPMNVYSPPPTLSRPVSSVQSNQRQAQSTAKVMKTLKASMPMTAPIHMNAADRLHTHPTTSPLSPLPLPLPLPVSMGPPIPMILSPPKGLMCPSQTSDVAPHVASSERSSPSPSFKAEEKVTYSCPSGEATIPSTPMAKLRVTASASNSLVQIRWPSASSLDDLKARLSLVWRRFSWISFGTFVVVCIGLWLLRGSRKAGTTSQASAPLPDSSSTLMAIMDAPGGAQAPVNPVCMCGFTMDAYQQADTKVTPYAVSVMIPQAMKPLDIGPQAGDYCVCDFSGTVMVDRLQRPIDE
ncbi:WD40-repeat-containing domain protein [Panaeolus papilionaceus]|nr:WD40-repeat-containing domain protein [Panaeolus papilionaceus]